MLNLNHISAPTIHHLLFADDSFVFAQSSLNECIQVKSLLETYKKVSGQAVNGARI